MRLISRPPISIVDSNDLKFNALKVPLLSTDDLFRTFFPIVNDFSFNSQGTYSPLTSSTNIVSLGKDGTYHIWIYDHGLETCVFSFTVFSVNDKLKIQNRDKNLSLSLFFLSFPD